MKTQAEIYLDNSATTRQYDEVTAFMAEVASDSYGNPSSLHTKGIEAERIVRNARETIAATLGAEPKEIYFTSGGTESNNLAIRGYLGANPRKGRHIITTKIEHPSVLEVYRHLEEAGYKVDYIGVDKDGRVCLEELKDRIDSETALISAMIVNNETGTIQRMEEISAIRDLKSPQAVIHADAVQAYGKIALNPSAAGIGLMSVSSHKIHGPKGIGALYSSRGIKLKPLFYGGGQEALLRSGTENVPGIAGFGLAAKLTFDRIDENMKKAALLRKTFTEGLSEFGISCRIVSSEDGLPYILNIAFENVKAEVLLHHLEQKNIYVSTGSACSSRKNIRSHVLSAMGLAPGLADGAVRFSFSALNTPEEIKYTVEMLKEIIPRIVIKKRQKQ